MVLFEKYKSFILFYEYKDYISILNGCDNLTGEIIQDYCEKCLCYTNKVVDDIKNTLTCRTCDAQEDFYYNEASIESELLSIT
jgi:hypothetical protein